MGKAPWKDFKGNDICEGDTILHPSGERGVVVIRPDRGDVHDRWFAKYRDGIESRLSLQIGERGQAVVVVLSRVKGPNDKCSPDPREQEGI